jgi:hypothetical protein
MTFAYVIFALGRLSVSMTWLFAVKFAEPVPAFFTVMFHVQLFPTVVLPPTESVFVAIRSGCVTVSDAEPLLPECTLSVGVYVAVMLRGLVPRSWGVTVAVHVAAFPPPFASVQVVNVSFVSGEENAIVPPGFDWVPVELVSVTVTVMVLAWPKPKEIGLRETLVEVVRALTVSAAALLLVECALSVGV